MQLIRDRSYFIEQEIGASSFLSQKTHTGKTPHAVTIGNFDGVHRGHQAVLKKLTVQAKELNIPSLAVCFEPQPLEYFLGKKAPARLSSLTDKYRYLSCLGVDRLFCLRFNRDLAQMSATDFVETVLLSELNTKVLVVGDDFTFGADRKGDFSLLARYAEEHQFKLISSDSLLVDSERVSSTQIRSLLERADFKQADRALGHPYLFIGRVSHGRKLGRQLGFPTANIVLRRTVLPLNGVFVVRVNSPTLTNCYGVANLGVKPTVQGVHPVLEVHLFDCDQNLYTQRLEVEFLHKLREEQKFATVADLKQQINKDVGIAKEYLLHLS